jgi:hypothetical protein
MSFIQAASPKKKYPKPVMELKLYLIPIKLLIKVPYNTGFTVKW